MFGYIEDIIDKFVSVIKHGSYDRKPADVYKNLIPTHLANDQDFVIVVNPAGVEDVKTTRCHWQKTVEVRVIIRDYIPVRGDANIDNGQSSEAEDMITVCQQVKDELIDQGTRIDTLDNKVFTLSAITHSPLYDYSALLEDSTFISVISLTYEGFV